MREMIAGGPPDCQISCPIARQSARGSSAPMMGVLAQTLPTNRLIPRGPTKWRRTGTEPLPSGMLQTLRCPARLGGPPGRMEVAPRLE
jgi:hypothetical protein